jgi:hypothetical protein
VNRTRRGATLAKVANTYLELARIGSGPPNGTTAATEQPTDALRPAPGNADDASSFRSAGNLQTNKPATEFDCSFLRRRRKLQSPSVDASLSPADLAHQPLHRLSGPALSCRMGPAQRSASILQQRGLSIH